MLFSFIKRFKSFKWDLDRRIRGPLFQTFVCNFGRLLEQIFDPLTGGSGNFENAQVVPFGECLGIDEWNFPVK